MRASLLQPRHNQEQEVIGLRKNKAKQAFYYNRGARVLPPLQVGDQVRMRLPDAPSGGLSKQWTAAQVVDKVSPRSYRVSVGTAVLRRNQRDLIKAHQTDEGDELGQAPEAAKIAAEDEQPVDNDNHVTDDYGMRPPSPTAARRESRRLKFQTKRFGYDE